MILAAGRGARLSPLTDSTPKPLLKVGNRPLLDWQLDKLEAAGFSDCVINLGYLGGQIRQHLSRNPRTRLRIEFSEEPATAFETGGGILAALPLLGDQPFAVINADIWTDYDYRRLRLFAEHKTHATWLGHLVMVANPKHNPSGDFGLRNGWVNNLGAEKFTFTGISVLQPKLFEQQTPGRFPLAPLLRAAAARKCISGELHFRQWSDIGTSERLNEINQFNISSKPKTEV